MVVHLFITSLVVNRNPLPKFNSNVGLRSIETHIRQLDRIVSQRLIEIHPSVQ